MRWRSGSGSSRSGVGVDGGVREGVEEQRLNNGKVNFQHHVRIRRRSERRNQRNGSGSEEGGGMEVEVIGGRKRKKSERPKIE